MNQYPAKPMMDEMAKHGRYGDTMLVHMNPVEVAGLASLSPTGQLSTNPVTGQPEAFIPLLFGGLGSLLKLSPLMTGVLTGAGTAAVTGDLKRGILSGLTAGFGAGAADAAGLAEVGTAAGEAATTGADVGAAITDAAQDTGMSLVSDVTSTAIPEPGMLDQIRSGVPDVLKAQPEGITSAVDKLGFTGNLMGAGITGGMEEQMKMEERFADQTRARQAEAEADRREAFDDLQRGYAMAQPGIPTGLSAGRSEMSRRTPPPMYMADGGATTTTKEDGNPYAALGAARDIARFMGGARGYFGVDPVTVQQRLRGPDVIAPPKDYMPGFEPEFSYFQDASEGIAVPDRSYRPMRQGVISRGQYFDPVLQAPQSNAQMNEYRRTLEKLDPGPMDIGSVMGLASEGSTLSTPQQNVFEAYYSQPPAPPPADTTTDTTTTDTSTTDIQVNDALRSYFPGMSDQEIIDALRGGNFGGMFASGTNPFGINVPNLNLTSVPSQTSTGDTSQPDFVSAFTGQTPDLAQIMAMYPSLTQEQAQAITSLNLPTLQFQGGGQIPEVMLQTSLGAASVPAGGIAQVPTEFTGASEQQSRLNRMTGLPFGEEGEDVRRDVQALEAAVLGEVNEELAEQITNMFVQKYGPDVYRVARDSILRRSSPSAQTEGMISGPGGGMDDMVQGMIGSEQPVAVSPGEFIVPADVVSGLGDGSSDAGAEKLDMMMERVRMERNGTTRQAPQIDDRKVMPA